MILLVWSALVNAQVVHNCMSVMHTKEKGRWKMDACTNVQASIPAVSSWFQDSFVPGNPNNPTINPHKAEIHLTRKTNK